MQFLGRDHCDGTRVEAQIEDHSPLGVTAGVALEEKKNEVPPADVTMSEMWLGSALDQDSVNHMRLGADVVLLLGPRPSSVLSVSGIHGKYLVYLLQHSSELLSSICSIWIGCLCVPSVAIASSAKPCKR